MRQEDPRKTRSNALLIDAIIKYMDGGVAPTITEITTLAGVSRPTFYQHFGDLPTAYTAAAVARIQKQFALIPHQTSTERGSETFILNTLTGLLTHLDKHRVFYTMASRNGGDELYESIIKFLETRLTSHSPFTKSFHQGSSTPDSMIVSDQATVLSAGIFWLIKNWLITPNPDPVSQTAQRVLTVITAFLQTPQN